MNFDRRHAVGADLYDIWAYRAWLLLYPALAQLAVEGEELLPFFPFLLEDIFRALYKEDVVLAWGNDLLPHHRAQREVIERLRQQGWLTLLRPTTTLNEGEAIHATEMIGRALLDLMQGRTPSFEKRGDLRALPLDELTEMLGQMLEEMSQEGQASEGEGKEAMREEVMARLEHLRQRLRQEMARWEEDVVGSEEVEKLVSGEEAGLGGGEYFQADTRKEFEKALSWMEDLRRFARALGRLMQTNFPKRLERAYGGAEEIYEVETGRDLSRILPSELVKLAHPFLRKVFWLSYARGDLLLYKLRSRAPLGKGSKIFVVDLSYSTFDFAHLRQAMEKLMALALLLYSRKNEAYAIIYFTDDNRPPVVILDNPPTVAQWLDIATRYGRGGTDVTYPLNTASRLIEHDHRFKNADIILFTDGKLQQRTWYPKGRRWESFDAFVKEFLENKAELGFTVVTVLIDWRGGFEEEHAARFSDRVIMLTELLTADELKEIAGLFVGPPKESQPYAKWRAPTD